MGKIEKDLGLGGLSGNSRVSGREGQLRPGLEGLMEGEWVGSGLLLAFLLWWRWRESCGKRLLQALSRWEIRAIQQSEARVSRLGGRAAGTKDVSPARPPSRRGAGTTTSPPLAAALPQAGRLEVIRLQSLNSPAVTPQ